MGKVASRRSATPRQRPCSARPSAPRHPSRRLRQGGAVYDGLHDYRQRASMVTTASSTLLARHASAMIRSAAAHGFPWSTISAAVQLTPEDLRAERFDGNAFFRISREVKLLMSDEFCGFSAGRCPIGTFGEMCARAVTAPTIGKALQLAFELYAERTRDVRFELRDRGEIATVNMTVEHPETAQHELLYEWWFLVWPSLASWLAREEIPVVAVDLPHAPLGEPEEYAEVLSGVCRFRQPVARLLLPERHLRKPVLREPSEVPEFMSPRSELRLLSGERTIQAAAEAVAAATPGHDAIVDVDRRCRRVLPREQPDAAASLAGRVDQLSNGQRRGAT